MEDKPSISNDILLNRLDVPVTELSVFLHNTTK